MTDATDVLEQTRNVLKETEGRIRNHKYIADLAAGTFPIGAFKAFPGHQYHMWKCDLRSAATFVSRFGDRPYGDFFIGDLQAEIEAKEGMLVLAGKLGMTQDDLERYEPSATGFAYSAYFAWLAAYGSAAEVACGLALNLAAWGANCAAIGVALRERYGFTAEETVFLDRFGSVPSFEDAALDIIADDLKRGVETRQIVRAARLIQSYEEMFWDAMSAADEDGHVA